MRGEEGCPEKRDICLGSRTKLPATTIQWNPLPVSMLATNPTPLLLSHPYPSADTLRSAPLGLRGRRADLLEADVHVEGEGLSRVAHRGEAVLAAGGGAAGDQLHRVGARVVTHLWRTGEPQVLTEDPRDPWKVYSLLINYKQRKS